jgi:hypothetical protein
MVASRHDEGAKAYFPGCIAHLDLSLAAAPNVQHRSNRTISSGLVEYRILPCLAALRFGVSRNARSGVGQFSDGAVGGRGPYVDHPASIKADVSS